MGRATKNAAGWMIESNGSRLSRPSRLPFFRRLRFRAGPECTTPD